MLVGPLNGTAAVEHSLLVLKKLNIELPYWPCNSTPRYLPKRSKCTSPQKVTCEVRGALSVTAPTGNHPGVPTGDGKLLRPSSRIRVGSEEARASLPQQQRPPEALGQVKKPTQRTTPFVRNSRKGNPEVTGSRWVITRGRGGGSRLQEAGPGGFVE